MAVDLIVTAAAARPLPWPTQNVTIIVTVDNNEDLTTATSVDCSLPADMTFVSATPSVGTYDPDTEIWTIGGMAVAPSANETITIVVTPTTTAGTRSLLFAPVGTSTPASTGGNETGSQYLGPLLIRAENVVGELSEYYVVFTSPQVALTLDTPFSKVEELDIQAPSVSAGKQVQLARNSATAAGGYDNAASYGLASFASLADNVLHYLKITGYRGLRIMSTE